MRGLYAILDSSYIPAGDLTSYCQTILEAGCRVIQYRDKQATEDEYLVNAEKLLTLCRQYNAHFIVNDHLSIAATLECGVHLGGDDAAIKQAREALGANAIIGASCYNRIELAEQAKLQGATYIAFGAFFSSPTKPQAVVAASSIIAAAKPLDLPIVAIGGITPDNGAQLVAAGADMLAVISDLWQADDISARAKQYQSLYTP